MDLDVTVEEYIGESVSGEGNKQIRLVAYAARSEQETITSKDHDQLKWISIYEFGDYNFAPADIPIIEALLMKRIAIVEQLAESLK
ncbi:hypothetical protein [uncultured Pontibacter sp.]|uniref:hypothetical protein n=1 Tax=uncultured Pontibacter sp. TaxID=453356 RepID=UPI0034267D9D